MAYQALYRKYRPKTFSEVVGQEHITETLKNELATNKTVHAYLFTGTRGTGKTSCAKILAKAVNCLNSKNGDPCHECEACRLAESGECTDIVEIDAASNNNVDNIRDLREQISFTPTALKYRVYIIDEVHMLTMQAFNALLKTLEEPPAHVVFILATTEVHKLPATILSRCQRFDFRRIEPEKICSRIKYIAEKENLTVTDEAATLIASAADGGMRDALSIFDLCASGNTEINEEVVSKVCAMAGNEYLKRLADAIKASDTEKALLLLDELHSSSVDMLRLLGELTGYYRNLMIMKTIKSENKPIVCTKSQLESLEKQASDYDIKDIMRVLTVLQAAAAPMQSGNRRCEMEMAIIRLCNPSLSEDYAAIEKRIRNLESGVVTAKPIEPMHQEVKEEKKEEMSAEKQQPVSSDIADDEEIPLPDDADIPNEDSEPVAEEPKKEEKAAEAPSGVTPVSEWGEVIKILRTTAPLMAGVLNGSAAYIKGEYLLIDAPNEQFRSMIKSAANYKDQIRNAAAQVLGVSYKLGPYTKAAEENNDDPLLKLAGKLKNLEIQ